MGTYTALHLHSTAVDQVQEMCIEWLQNAHRPRPVSVEHGKFPLKELARPLGDKLPTLLAMGITHPGWTTIHYNSFYKMGDLAAQLSTRLDCRSAVVLAQTVSDYYYVDVYQAGERLRMIEFAMDEGWLAQEGTPLPFESTPLGEDIADPGEEPCTFFGASDAESYCNGLGFSIWGEEFDPVWAILRARRSWWPFQR